MNSLHIVKIGGQVIDQEENLIRFLKVLVSADKKFILVHGGGKTATNLAGQMGLSQCLVQGRRVTDAATLKIACMVYAGLINKQIVARLQALGIDALGLSGADLNCIRTVKREAGEIDYGYVGDLIPEGVDAGKFNFLLKGGFTPVVCAITHDGKGQLLNTNADTLASELAIALSGQYEVHLHYCFEKKGVLQDAEDENSAITGLDSSLYDALRQKGVISKGMIPKLDNAFKARHNGVGKVRIGHSDSIKQMILQTNFHGTELIE
ncbi:MAG TPA: acetylglutamate kinase [Bacteroidia bacterium]|jgi:acetylglutamate kinase|nr:acetylglutamate kinase [Bacteroidia bacterium]